MDIDTSRLRRDLPQVGTRPYRQVHAHSTAIGTQAFKMRQTITGVKIQSQAFSLMW